MDSLKPSPTALLTIHPLLQPKKKMITEAEKRAGYCVKFDLDELLKSDTKTRAEYNRNMFNIGAISIDEIRLKEGLRPLNTKGSKKHFVPLNMGDIESNNANIESENEPVNGE